MIGIKLEPPGFWSENSNIGYKNLSICLENQYSKFIAHQLPEKIRLNGTRTLDGTIADIGGVRMAYHGYCKYEALIFKENELDYLISCA